MDKLKIFLWASVLLVSSVSSATIIEGTFTGTIFSSVDEEYIPETDTWTLEQGLLNGMTLTGTFTYDTDQVPANIFSITDKGTYFQDNLTDWLDITLQLNDSIGTVYEFNDSFSDRRSSDIDYDLLSISDNWGYPLYPRDQFYVQEYHHYNGFDAESNYIYEHNAITLDITSFINEFTNGINPDQTFEIIDMTGFNAIGSYDVNDDFFNNSTQKYDYGYGKEFEFNLNTLSMADVTASVPEPSMIALLSIGLIGMCVASKRRKH